jgi:hypothetical protein
MAAMTQNMSNERAISLETRTSNQRRHSGDEIVERRATELGDWFVAIKRFEHARLSHKTGTVGC